MLSRLQHIFYFIVVYVKVHEGEMEEGEDAFAHKEVGEFSVITGQG